MPLAPAQSAKLSSVVVPAWIHTDASVCIQAGTTTELNLADWAGANGISYDSVVVETSQQSLDGFLAGRCDVLTSDVSQLASLRAAMDDPSAAALGSSIAALSEAN